MRLIDADELIRDLMEQIPLAENVPIFRDIIESQETAYDIDKVVNELEEQINIAKSDFNLTKENILLVTISELQRARAIVKQGLKEQK